MNNFASLPVWSGVLVILLSAICVPAQADFGPKPNDRQRVTVTMDGRPLPDTRFVAAILCQRLKPSRQPWNMAAEVPGLELALPPSDAAGTWSYASYRWGGKGRNGQVEFNGFVNGLPNRFRVAVFLPSGEQVFITNEAETHPLLNRFHVNLSADGTATLVRDQTGQWLADGLVGLARQGMLRALAITLVIEWLVVILVLLALNKRQLMVRMVATCLGVNLVTLPALWVACLIGYWMLGLWAGSVVLVLLEVFVFLLEGAAYAVVGRLGWKWGLAVAFMANALSFLLGLIIHQGATL